MKGKKINFKLCVLIASILLVVLLALKILMSPLFLSSKSLDVEINTKLNASENIKFTLFGKKDDVKIDDSKVVVNKLGTYPLIYTYHGKEYEVDVNVVDTIPPVFETVPFTIEAGIKFSPKNLVKNIKDATKTTVRFKNERTFTQAGEYEVGVIVTDEGGNETEKDALVNVVEDVKPPEAIDLQPLSVVVGGNLKLMQGVNINKAGTYEVSYKASDRSGNEITIKREVKVVNSVGRTNESKRKIVYLTFDDGPSSNTKKILDILKKNNIKATFFVTGLNKEYNYLIKRAEAEGHTIALHTYSHDYKKVYSSMDAYFKDLNKLEDMVKGLIGYSPKYIRFPGGSSNTVSKEYKKKIMTRLTKEVLNRGYQYYDWNCDSTDASGNNVAVSELVKNATLSREYNINILFHDTDAKDTTVKALQKIINKYKKRGYEFRGIDASSYAPHHGVNN